MNLERIVESGYDRIAEQYLATKKAEDSELFATIEELARNRPSAGAALDLGCGAGVPVTEWLTQRFEVTGVDVSARQLDLARQRMPGARFVKADMAEVDFPDETFDIVVALYSIIHVPRTVQPALISRIHRWLKPDGAFLATWAVEEWEGQEENWEGWGAPMWWSHFGADTNVAMIETAGFEIISAERRTINEERWLWILARR